MSANDISQWYIVHTHHKQEDRVEMNLSDRGITTFNLKIKEQEYNSYFDKVKYVIKPLFPGYIFAQFSTAKLRQVKFTKSDQATLAHRVQPRGARGTRGDYAYCFSP